MAPLIGYASVTNGETFDALIAAGWGILFAPYALSAFGPQRRLYESSPPGPYCLDCGAWSQKGGDVFDPFAYMRLVGLMGAQAEFVVLPDIVAGGRASLERSLRWVPVLEPICERVLIPAQNGITPDDLWMHLGPKVGVFLGGTDSYKLRTMETWGQVAREADCYYHVGRVNSATRIRLCGAAGADSFDGSGVSIYGNVPHSCAYLPKLEAARAAASRPPPTEHAQRALFPRSLE